MRLTVDIDKGHGQDWTVLVSCGDPRMQFPMIHDCTGTMDLVLAFVDVVVRVYAIFYADQFKTEGAI